MSQKIKDGIILDSTVYVNDEKSSGVPQYMRLIQLFAVIIGCHSVISIFMNCFSLDVSKTLITAAVFLISIVLFLLVWYPLHDFIKIISAAVLYLLILFRWIGKLKNGFYLLENAVIERASSYYGFIGIRFMADYTEDEKDMAFLLIMVLIPVIAVVTIAVIRHKLVYLCYILLLLPVAASFAFGITPPEIYLVAYIVDMLFLARSCGLWKFTKYKDRKTIIQSVNLKSAIVISMIALTLFLLMKLFIPAYKYERVTKIKEAKTKIQTFIYSFSIKDTASKLEDFRWKIFKSGSKATGGLSDGKLGRVDEVKYNNEEHLRITVPETSISEGIYLKGYVGSVYTGDSWEGPTPEMRNDYKKLQAQLSDSSFEPVNQNAIFLHRISLLNDDVADLDRPGSITQQCNYYFNKGSIKIKYYTGDTKHIYAPYFTDFEASKDADYKWDLYAEPKTRKQSYEFDYYYNIFKGDGLSDYLKPFDTRLGNYAANEKLYRKYVYQTYTKLPQKGLERLKADFSKSNVGAKASSVQGAISYIKDYLDNNTQYTLSPGKLPSGKDFAEYFLYESGRGYCTHYATAGVLMLRAMGIPARYVEGYAVNSSDIMTGNSTDKQVNTSYSDQDNYEYFENQVKVTVRDYNAHAWAEVYIDGCGWYPVEFTPGSGVDIYSNYVILVMLSYFSPVGFTINIHRITPSRLLTLLILNNTFDPV